MGRITRYRGLPDQAYDPRVTDLTNPVRPPGRKPGEPMIAADQFRNRNVSNTTPFQLVAGAVAIRALPKNLRRTGLQIQNKDATGVLFYAFGNGADISGLQLAAGASALYDFTTPSDELYLFSANAIQVTILEMSRGA